MFKLMGQPLGYKIFFGSRVSVFARNDEEAINCLKHYLMKKHNKRKCPSCK